MTKIKENAVVFEVWDRHSKLWLMSPLKARCITHEGKLYKLFRVGALGKCLGRTPDAIQQWEREGKFPCPTFTLEDSPHRYYTEDQIRMTAFMYRTILGNNPDALRGQGLNMIGFFAAVNEHWNIRGFDPHEFEVKEVETGKNDVHV